MRSRVGLAAIFVFLLATRLLQSDLLWVEEGYPSAAALQMLEGKALYRDIWFDKPPLSAVLYLVWGAHIGVPLRIGGALFLFACCLMLYRFGRRVWGESEALAASGLLAFFLTFGIPAAVIAIAPDLAMILPHIAAVYLAWRRRPLAAGAMAGIAMLTNTKGIFVLAACAVWQFTALPWLLAGFVAVSGIAWLLPGYQQQVWQWGLLYARDTFVQHPLAEGFSRTMNWVGFHAALVVGAACAIWRERRWREALWIAIVFLGVIPGLRFFPRYYFLLLPPLCLLAGRTFAASKSVRLAMLGLMLIPAVRFGPRLVNHRNWADITMMDDSRSVAALLNAQKKAGDSLLVWGYRPDIFAFTQIPAGTRYLDSQPLTGVLADRHLTQSTPVAPELAVANRRELAATSPTFIVDGLGRYNPALAISRYDDLRPWLSRYREISGSAGCILYRRID